VRVFRHPRFGIGGLFPTVSKFLLVACCARRSQRSLSTTARSKVPKPCTRFGRGKSDGWASVRLYAFIAGLFRIAI
jgi:hypothetical protein